ncbi:MAG TPA: DUF2892 domain-containing protein [Polyangiaceae bacterium]|nr:DUF2892 domain-containing protein [Polyangiaceae bacterium]
MKKNLNTMHRSVRALAAVGMAGCAAVAPVSHAAQLGLGALAAYLGFTALAGSCVGLRLMGRSTCAVEEHG